MSLTKRNQRNDLLRERQWHDLYQLNGTWHRGRMTAAELLKQEEENRATSKPASCQYRHDESVNSEAATVYSASFESEAGKTAITIWISKSRGVPLKQEMDRDVGGSAGKSHQSVRYEYTNVHLPCNNGPDEHIVLETTGIRGGAKIMIDYRKTTWTGM